MDQNKLCTYKMMLEIPTIRENFEVSNLILDLIKKELQKENNNG
jgi:hypothetical protein